MPCHEKPVAYDHATGLLSSGGDFFRLHIFSRRRRERLLDLAQLLALVGQLVGEGELSTLPRLVGRQPAPVFLQPLAIALPLLLEPVERMFEPGDGS